MPATTGHTTYKGLIAGLTENESGVESNGTSLIQLGESLKHLKGILKVTYQRHCKNGLGTERGQSFDHVVEALERYGNLQNLHALSFDGISLQTNVETEVYRRGTLLGC